MVDGDESGEDSFDSPYLAVNQERVRNHLYRALERDDVDIDPDDVSRLDDALDELSPDELQRFGDLARRLEAQDREGLSFLELTDAEREYFALLETALERLPPAEKEEEEKEEEEKEEEENEEEENEEEEKEEEDDIP